MVRATVLAVITTNPPFCFWWDVAEQLLTLVILAPHFSTLHLTPIHCSFFPMSNASTVDAENNKQMQKT